jgi:hypothetical protein
LYLWDEMPKKRAAASLAIISARRPVIGGRMPDGKKQAIGMTFPTVPAERVVEPGKSSLVSFAALPTIREGEGFLSTPGRRRDDTVGGIQVTETFPDRGSCLVSPGVTDFTGVHHTLSINVSCKELHQLVPRHEPIR